MRTKVRTGQVVTAVVLLFMIFDGVIHVLRIAPVVDAFRQLGYPLAAAVPLGVVEIVCVALLVMPATRVIGAVLLTAYFGGAIATQVRAGADWFPVLFPALLGALLWGGLSLFDGRVRGLILADGAR
jgi:hypothetical protein